MPSAYPIQTAGLFKPPAPPPGLSPELTERFEKNLAQIHSCYARGFSATAGGAVLTGLHLLALSRGQTALAVASLVAGIGAMTYGAAQVIQGTIIKQDERNWQ